MRIAEKSRCPFVFLSPENLRNAERFVVQKGIYVVTRSRKFVATGACGRSGPAEKGLKPEQPIKGKNMQLRKKLGLAGLVLAVLGVASAKAINITYTIEGTVNSATASMSGVVSAGDDYTLVLIADSDSATSVSPDTSQYSILSGNISFSNGYAGSFDPSASQIVVSNGASDNFEFNSLGGTFPPVDGHTFQSLVWGIGDFTGSVLPSQDLPVNIDLADWTDSKSIMLWDQSDGLRRNLTLGTSSVTVEGGAPTGVPDGGSTLALALTTIPGLLFVRRRIQRRNG